MSNYWKQFREAFPHAKFLFLNWALYGFMIIASTVYVYARLDYVRSNRPQGQKQIETKVQK